MSTSRLAQSARNKANYHFGKSFSEEIASRSRQFVSLLENLKVASATGGKRSLRAAQNRIFRSYSAKLVCLVLSFETKHGVTVEQLKVTARTINPARDCGETIVAWAEPKSSGAGIRPVYAFGLKRKGLQTLCVEILKACNPADEIDYLRKGRGAERASDRIVRMHDEKGLHHFVVADIKDFFRSVRIGKVVGLIGLPEAVVQNSILISQTPHLSIVGGLPPDMTLQCLIGTVREGIPQGSRASQTIASLILGQALKQICSAQLATMHGDDVVLGADSEKSAYALNTALFEALESHPAGPFRLKHSSVASLLGDGFDFLQYNHRHDYFRNVIHRRPSGLSHWRFRRRISILFASYKHRTAVRKSARYRRLWRNSFRKWRRWPNSDVLLWLGILEAMDEGKAKRAKIRKLIWLG